jgi:ACS family tartrate transporter-like MFS transporter
MSQVILNPLLTTAVRKSGRRLIPWLVVLTVSAMLDRANVGFAALTMNKDLGLTAQAFGFGATIFFVGYILFEIPSTLALARFGGRRWLSRIAITWGIATAMMALSVGHLSYYVLRFLVGVAEAGALPGVFFFLAQWFPSSTRGRYTALFITAIPLANALSGPISSRLVQLQGVAGLAGWQWLFLIEGAVSVGLGVLCYYFLKDGPANATWLNPDERQALVAALEEERRFHEIDGRISVWQSLSSPTVLVLALGYTGINIQINSAALWFPQIFRSYGLSTTMTGFASAVPFLCGAVAMVLWGRRSDAAGERVLHIVAAMLLSICGWAAAGFCTSAFGAMLALSVATIGFFSAGPLYWTLPSSILTGPAAAAAIALTSAAGNLGSAITAPIIGTLRDNALKQGGGWAAPMLFIAVYALGTPVIVLALRGRLARGRVFSGKTQDIVAH